MRKILGIRRSPHWAGSAAGAALAAGLAGALAACGGVASAGSVAGAGGGAAHATPEPPRCGAVITADTTLRADLTGCTGDGLVIGADGITLNLDGHTIAGTAGAVAGIRAKGRHGVTVTGGIQPDWSPDGSHIIFALDPTNDQFTHPDNAPYTITAQGTDLRLVNGRHDFKSQPEWWQ